MSVVKTFLMLYIISYSMNQAFGIICYQCNSIVDSKCDSDPKNTIFELECSTSVKSSASMLNTTLLSLQTNITSIQDNNFFDECLKMTGTRQKSKYVMRSCSSTIIADDYWKKVATELGITVESLSRCQSNLCNSSSSLNILFASFIGAFLLVLVMNM
ncbi:uncharacterized protein LOC131669305 [Phymastichus coffea]|uniref:uncharacterized protein LOC131669305 n=1 Tax=Phymastichus coffea TaxID=108790 RepID=UPI00273B4CBB|nr:uncharacterized protein LOC131669305 [Phymastichus coffea]